MMRGVEKAEGLGGGMCPCLQILEELVKKEGIQLVALEFQWIADCLECTGTS